MLLTHVFSPENIKTPLESTDKGELFEEMVDLYVSHASLISSSDALVDRNTILNALWARENKMSTAIRDGIALPHARIAGLVEPVGIIGISKEGIHYDSSSSSLIYFVFMLLSTTGDSALHLHILSNINILLGNLEFLNHLLKQNSASGIYKLIEEYEASMLEI